MASSRPNPSSPSAAQSTVQDGSRSASSRKSAYRSLSQLWQFPLLVVALGAFGYAAYRFIDPKAGPTLDQKIAAARSMLVEQDRPRPAIDALGNLLVKEKLDKAHEGQIHLLLAEALEAGQKQLKIGLPRNYQNIVEQTRSALANGVRPTYEIHRRLAESYEGLQQPTLALQHYRESLKFDPPKQLAVERKIIDLQLTAEDFFAASESLENYLKHKELVGGERAWALGEQSHLLMDAGKFPEAIKVLEEANTNATEPLEQGQINYWLGYCAWKLDDRNEAERLMRLAREQFKEHHALDGDAAYFLGRIAQEREAFAEAVSLYEVVLVGHPDSKVAIPSKLGRGVCRVMLEQDAPGLVDLHDAITVIKEKPSAGKFKVDAVESLRTAADSLAKRSNFRGAVELMTAEQELNPDPGAKFFARLGLLFEKRADQLEHEAATTPTAQAQREQELRDTRGKAGDAYVAYSRALTIADDHGYADALWRGIDLYDRCGELPRAISALTLFVKQSPNNSLTPEALLRLGRTYQACGLYDEAIDAFQQNQLQFPKTLGASQSAIPLAQAYIAKGGSFYRKAENVLLGVIENNPLVTPDAVEFREAIFNLAQLYYRTSRYEEAVGRLEEMTDRYPNEPRMAQLIFLKADSYRKSAALLNNPPATRPASQPVMDPAEVVQARNQRLRHAQDLFDRVVDMYKKDGTKTDNDKLYQRFAHFYRADCAYDLGNYEEAVRLYGQAADRYPNDPSTLAAYIQMVNSHCALGHVQEAKAANERAKWLLRSMPPDSFASTMPKEYWEKWLQWTSNSGLWQ